MNLIICGTPLQMRIAEKIIKLHPGEEFFSFVFGYENPKYIHYYHRLQRYCSHAKLILDDQIKKTFIRGKLRKTYYFWKLKKNLSLPVKTFNKVFICNAHESIPQIILSMIKFNVLFTFDDGSANILPTSFFYQPDPVKRKSFWPCKSIYTPKQLLALSQKHYTIYPGYKNIIANTETISLWSEPVKTSTIDDSESPITIMLGQPLYERHTEKSQRLMQNIVDQFGIENYFQHPREHYQLANVNDIKTELIFEDYLFTVLSKKSDSRYEIYTTGSSVVLHIAQLPNVKIKLIQVADMEKMHSWYLDLMDLYTRFGIEKIKFQPNVN